MDRKRVRTEGGEKTFAKKLRETKPSEASLEATEHLVALRLKDIGLEDVEPVDKSGVLEKCVGAVDRVLLNRTNIFKPRLLFFVGEPSPTTTRKELANTAESLFTQVLVTQRQMAEQKSRLENKLKNVMRIMEVVGTCESLKDAYMYAVDYVENDIIPDLSCYEYDE